MALEFFLSPPPQHLPACQSVTMAQYRPKNWRLSFLSLRCPPGTADPVCTLEIHLYTVSVVFLSLATVNSVRWLDGWHR